MPHPREALITEAIAEIRAGAKIKPTAKKYGLVRSTLQGRLRGAAPMHEARKNDQKLSPEQEAFLAQWILHEEVSGRAPNRRRVVSMGNSILAESGHPGRLGKRWIDRFVKRHPEIKWKNADLLERARARGSTRQAFEAFFDLLERHVREKKLKPCNIANMDEHGLQEGESQGGRVLGTSLTSRTYLTASDATTWVSIIECGTAEGRRLTPCIIFTGASLQGQWFSQNFEKEKELPGWKYDYSTTGWSNATIALKWLKEIYLPETQPKNRGEWRLLVLDEHSSHTTDEFLRMAYLHKVQLLFLPPHTSHKTQPLDRSVFAAVKQYFRDAAGDLADYSASAPVNKQRFAVLYREAARKGVCAANLRSGFRQCGIWPINRERILQDPEAVIEPEFAIPTPSTPPRQADPPEYEVWATPRGSQDVQKFQEVLTGSFSAAQRDVRIAFRKIGRALDTQAVEIAHLRSQLARKELEIQGQKPRTRKRVKIGGNERFARTAEIEEAKNASLEAPESPEPLEPTLEPAVIAQAENYLNTGLQSIQEHLEDEELSIVVRY
jgi:4-hydroxybenzoate polyprenyltransferase